MRYPFAAACLCLLSCVTTASADDAIVLPNAYVHPSNGASEADVVYSLIALRCDTPTLDPRREPEITYGPEAHPGDVGSIRVHYFLVMPDGTPCPDIMEPDVLVAHELGQLSEGITLVSQTFSIRDIDGDTYRDLSTISSHGIVVGDTPNPAVSGTWFDPATPGAGVSLSLQPDSGNAEPGAVLFLATLDAAGQPLWLSGHGQFSDAVLQVDLTRPQAAADGIDSVPAGSATFEYLGCGEAVLSVDGVDVRFPANETSLQQLTRTAGLPSCEPPPQPQS